MCVVNNTWGTLIKCGIVNSSPLRECPKTKHWNSIGVDCKQENCEANDIHHCTSLRKNKLFAIRVKHTFQEEIDLRKVINTEAELFLKSIITCLQTRINKTIAWFKLVQCMYTTETEKLKETNISSSVQTLEIEIASNFYSFNWPEPCQLFSCCCDQRLKTKSTINHNLILR